MIFLFQPSTQLSTGREKEGGVQGLDFRADIGQALPTPWALAVELDAEANIKVLRSIIGAVHANDGLCFRQLMRVGCSGSPGVVKHA